jgi:hypothetical protein
VNSGELEPYPWVDDDPKATITTGWPATSLLATRGSDPIDLEAPFGGRQGTRLKMSPADFATSFTLSIALPVTPFCAAGLPVAAGAACGGALSAEGLFSGLFSVLALSDSAACGPVCCEAVWACSGNTEAGINSARPAAEIVSNVDKRKGQ